MEKYKYKAYNKLNERVIGEFKGNIKEFRKFIRKKEYILISYEKSESKLKDGKFRQKDFIGFIEELSYLISSGLSIDNSISIILNNANNVIQKNFFSQILQNLKEGNQFSYSLNEASKKYNIKIDKLSILLISTNEEIGNLAEGLLKVKEHLQFKEILSSEIRQALSYPLFLITMSILMVFFVFMFIVPKFASIFTPEEFNSLPYLSKIIMETGIFVEQNISSISLFITVFILLIAVFKEKVLNFVKTGFMSISYFRNIFIKLQLAYFFSSVSLMLKGGIDLKKTLTLSSDLLTYSPLKSLILGTINNLKQGITISESFNESSFIPSNVVSLINAGEESAKLEDVFESLSSRYLNDFKTSTKTFLTILEPLVIVIMGVIIAIIVLSIMLAVMSITDIAG